MKTPSLLALFLGLVLTACGDEPPAIHAADTPSSYGAGGAFVDGARKAVFAVELDDDTLGDLLALHRRVLSNADNPARAIAAVKAMGWDHLTYAKAIAKWSTVQDVVERGPEQIQGEIDRMRERVAAMSSELESASGAEREQLETRHQMRASMLRGLEEMKKLATPGNAELVKKWKPRFDELEAEFD